MMSRDGGCESRIERVARVTGVEEALVLKRNTRQVGRSAEVKDETPASASPRPFDSS
jgi:hypothetical protein